MIAQFLRSIGRSFRQWVWLSRPPQANRPPSPVRRHPRKVLALTRWNASGEPPAALYWVPCHPATAARFKATIVCDRGHALTLKQHAVDAQGAVWPSVVCPTPGCEFHRYVQLDGWTGGAFE